MKQQYTSRVRIKFLLVSHWELSTTKALKSHGNTVAVLNVKQNYKVSRTCQVKDDLNFVEHKDRLDSIYMR